MTFFKEKYISLQNNGKQKYCPHLLHKLKRGRNLKGMINK